MDIQEAISQDFDILKQMDADEQKARDNLLGTLSKGLAPEAFDWEFLEQVLDIKRQTVAQLRATVERVTANTPGSRH